MANPWRGIPWCLPGPASRSQQHLGYVVNLGTGDRYKLPNTPGPAIVSSSVAGQQPGLDLKRGERLLKPVAVVR